MLNDNRGCALILARLYEYFPRPAMRDIAELDDGADLLMVVAALFGGWHGRYRR